MPPGEGPLCGARKKASRGGGTCRVAAGRGTDHVGTGACKHHGGCAKGGLKKGDKIALKSGRYETIFADVLDPGEAEIMAASAAMDEMTHMQGEIDLTTVRERRMLARIATLNAAGSMTVVEETVETIMPAEPAALPSERDLAEMTPAQADRAAGAAAEPVTKRKQKQAGTLGQIQAIEADLTAVQAHKARLLKNLHEMKNPSRKPGDLGDGEGDEVPDDAADARRSASLAALHDRARARFDGQAPGCDA